MRRFLVASLMACAALLSAGAALAVPNVIPYQGRLTDAAGNALSGAQSVVFAIYNVSTGGSALYTETQSVTAANGLFAVNIGSVTPLPASLWSQATLFLGIKVGADAEMTPRQSIGSVAFAERAASTDDAVGFSNKALGSTVVNNTSGAALGGGGVTLNAPAAGYALVSAGGYAYAFHNIGADDEFWLQVSPTSGSTNLTEGITVVRFTSALGTSVPIVPFTTQMIYPVVAGANTFYLNGKKIGGVDGNIGPSWLMAVFIPALRGTTSAPQSLMLPARPDVATPAPAAAAR